jgi:hypothetical protein
MEERPKRRDIWEKISLVLQSSGGLLTAITVAIIGLIGSSYLKDRELAENATRLDAQAYETNVRIYTELMSKREEAKAPSGKTCSFPSSNRSSAPALPLSMNGC